MRVIPIEITTERSIAHTETYQWDEAVRIDLTSADDLFDASAVVHAVKGRITQEVETTFISSTEIYADLPSWLFESAAEKAMVYVYQSGATVATAAIKVIPRGGLPVEDETITGLVAYRVNLNMIPTGNAPLTIHVSRFDKDGRTIRARMINGETVYEVPNSAQAVLLMTKPDGYGVEITCDVHDGYVYATLTDQACAVAGESLAEIRITEGGKTVGSANFIILVEESPFDENTVISDSEIPLLQEAIDAAVTSVAGSEDAEAWAVGQRGGINVDPTDAAYHNNAKYYAEQAGSEGVRSWNGQTGDITYTAPVTSVDGQTGDVTINKGVTTFNGEVGDVTYVPPVTSVNGQTGDVSITFDAGVTSFNGETGDINYAPPVTSVNGAIGDVTIDPGVTSFNGDTGAVTYEAPVSSVNGEVGDVEIVVPTKTSDLTNDSGFITDPGVTSFNGDTGDVTGVSSFNGITGDVTYTPPVTSVNGKTGAVTVLEDGDLTVTLLNVSSSSRIYSCSGITANHKLSVEGFAYLSNRAAAPGELTLVTTANTITVQGTLTDTTNIIATFTEHRTDVTATASS